MPLLTITLRGSELFGPTTVLLERPYDFTKLKLQHVYHNIDSINFATDLDKSNQCLLYIKLQGLVDSHKQLINYSGNYETMIRHPVQGRYDSSDHQLSTDTIAINSILSASKPNSTDRCTQSISVDHLIPIGASKHNSKEIISRDLYKTLHDGGVLNFSGELTFSLHYMNGGGAIKLMDSTTAGIVTVLKDVHISYFTMVFEYEE